MVVFLDARIPVRFADAAPVAADAAWLIQGDAAAPPGAAVARFVLPDRLPSHPTDCACCVPRGPVAEALTRLFLARARGEAAFFRQVIAVPADAAGRSAISAALRDDPMLAGRFRLASE
jgi:hypothetical protein